jgi:pimeloyl-ACP methyl ester carboxylesterase
MRKITLALVFALLFSAEHLTFAQSAATTKLSGKTTFGSHTKAGKYASVRGFKMYYEIYGTGKPLLLVHGNGGSIADFNNQIPYFAKNYKVIAADSRAQGKSADAGDSLSYEMMADDLDALLDQLHIDSCYVIGWSDGGINGLLLAMRHPEKVKKLAITGTNIWPDSTAIEPSFIRSITSLNDSLTKITQEPEVKAQRKLLELMIHNPNITTADLKKVKCPTLVIGGDNDVIFPEHTLTIASALPKSYLWILPDSGHSTLISDKTLFNQVVESFFKKPYKKEKGPAQLD